MFGEYKVVADIGGKGCIRLPDQLIAALAAEQHGVVARRQLLAARLSGQMVASRVNSGRLHHMHRGVYAVGHTLVSQYGRWMAAVLAVGPDAILSHASAAALWAIWRAGSGAIDVTAPRQVPSRPGIRVHTSRLPADERTTHYGIPVTSPFRTLLDLATVSTPQGLRRALHEAEAARLTDSFTLPALLARYPGNRGTRRLREAMADLSDGLMRTRSDLEDLFLTFIADRDLPRPETNVVVEVGGRAVEVDCLWRRPRLIVEVDSWRFHDTSRAFDQDRALRRALTAAGWKVVAVTWRQLEHEGDALEADLRALIGADG